MLNRKGFLHQNNEKKGKNMLLQTYIQLMEDETEELRLISELDTGCELKVPAYLLKRTLYRIKSISKGRFVLSDNDFMAVCAYVN